MVFGGIALANEGHERDSFTTNFDLLFFGVGFGKNIFQLVGGRSDV